MGLLLNFQNIMNYNLSLMVLVHLMVPKDNRSELQSDTQRIPRILTEFNVEMFKNSNKNSEDLPTKPKPLFFNFSNLRLLM